MHKKILVHFYPFSCHKTFDDKRTPKNWISIWELSNKAKRIFAIFLLKQLSSHTTRAKTKTFGSQLILIITAKSMHIPSKKTIRFFSFPSLVYHRANQRHQIDFSRYAKTSINATKKSNLEFLLTPPTPSQKTVICKIGVQTQLTHP